MSPGGPPIIIKRKKAGHHGGHHGGAWKVAYADFVTAMMAFFLVMWLVGQSKDVKSAVAGYFRDPGIFDQARSDGPIAGGDLTLDPEAAPPTTPADGNGLAAGERAALEETAKRIKQRLDTPELRTLGRHIEIQVTRDGLRIELVDAESQTFFASGSAALAAGTEKVLAVIAKELGGLKNSIVVEGHTDSRPYVVTDLYSNWELSADRANAARRVMERSGLHTGQVRGVRGYADRQLRVAAEPLDARNRRVSVIVEHLYRPSSLPPGVRELASGAKATPPAAVAAERPVVAPAPPSTTEGSSSR